MNTNYYIECHLTPKNQQLGQTPVCANLINEKLLPSSTQTQPICLNFCEQIITKCVGKESLEKLNENWKAYVSAFDELAAMLEKRYNFEAIISTLDVKISEAIMNFQENAENITRQVYAVCGDQPRPMADQSNVALEPRALSPRAYGGGVSSSNRIRKRRATTIAVGGISRLANPASRDSSPPSFSGSSVHPSALRPPMPRAYDPSTFNMRPKYLKNSDVLLPQRLPGHDDLASANPLMVFGDSLPKKSFPSSLLIGDIRGFMSKTKNFWSSLPNAVCVGTNHTSYGPIRVIQQATSQTIANLNNNDYSITSLNKRPLPGQRQPVVNQNCYQESLAHIDISYDHRHRFEISQAVISLSDIRSKIVQALQGQEIEWGPGGGLLLPGSNTRPSTPNRYPIVSPTTSSTTTTTTMLPLTDDDDDSDTSDDTFSEDGSGAEDSEDTNQAEFTDTPEPDQTFNEPITTPIPDNGIEESPTRDDRPDSESFIINPATPRASSQTSTKLVIDKSYNWMLVILVSFVSIHVVVFTSRSSYNHDRY